ncbi:HVA22-like protein a isoform X3 [Olea europaea var. sylvestris]|uniref:HVA22-like protein a isoform X3 n=1 Tax=Olea europaea var. sylvestris TaxID=158386 RepID=UPI000C1D309A|nr:HVA22-like protein a isoform X3 [Olea europaea var. sylvestris]
MGGSSNAASFLKVLVYNFDVLAGPVVSLVYPLLPFWSYAKLIFTCWLVIPYFSGAAFVYEHYVRPYLVTRQKSVNIWYVPRKKDVFSKQDDILTAAEKYIQENGTEAFEKLIHKERETTSRASSYSFYDDEYRY